MTHPVRFRITDDLRRSRLTVLFRIVLVIPHIVWLWLWTLGTLYVFLVFQWLATLFAGRMEGDAHSYISRYVRYQAHVYAYFFVLANPWPRFTGREGSYPIDLEVDGPERQNRLTVLLRLVLAIPAWIFSGVLNVVLAIVALLGWFASLALGRMPKGLRDLGAYCLRYQAQLNAYLFLLTPRYPSLASGTAASDQPFAD